MKSKATLATLATIMLMMTGPASADVIADQSRISVTPQPWVALETVVLPFLGTRTLQ